VDDDPSLADGPEFRWSIEAVQAFLDRAVSSLGRKPDMVLTFDSSGVSGHPNHIDVATGALMWSKAQRLELWQLESWWLPVKFSGAVGASLRLVWDRLISGDWSSSRRRLVGEISWTSVCAMHAGMLQHWSQYVWFRLLYIAFSQYVFVNQLRRVD
jgi:N-acetylglucosaminylphosphatidylinositol deacetylase